MTYREPYEETEPKRRWTMPELDPDRIGLWMIMVIVTCLAWCAIVGAGYVTYLAIHDVTHPDAPKAVASDGGK